MKTIIPFIIFFCGVVGVHGQVETFSVVYNNPFLDVGSSDGLSIKQLGDTLFVFGLIVKEDSTGNNVLQKYDLDGNWLSNKLWDPENDSLSANLGREGGVGYMEMGDSSFFTVPYLEFNNESGFNEAYLMLLNQYGQEFGRHPLDWDGRETYNIYQARSLSPREHLFCGVSWDSLGIGAVDDNAFLLKTNEFGETLWAQTYDSTTIFKYLEPRNNGDILISGFTMYPVGDYFQNTSDQILIKTDSLGEEQWRYVYGYAGPQQYPPVVSASDGTIVVLGIDGSGYYFLNGLLDGPLWFQRIQDNGTSFEIIDEGIYGFHFGHQTIPLGMKETPDGGFVAYGYAKNGYDEELMDEIDAAVIVKVDENLDSLWWHYYEYFPDAVNGRDNFFDMTVGDDGSLYLTGKAREGVNYEDYPGLEHIWVVKLDSMGCLEPGCNDAVIIDGIETIVIGLDNTMKVYPNPVKDQLQIDFSLPASYKPGSGNRLLLIDTQGRLVQNQPLPNNFENGYHLSLNLSGLSSGMYFLHWTDGDKWYDSVKVLKE